MPEYTLFAAISVPLVVLVELLWARTGIFKELRYWLAMLIVLGFQVPVDGWLTKLSDPIVIYAPEFMLGVRFPWDIPIEDFAFGWSMVTLTLITWKALDRRMSSSSPKRSRGGSSRKGCLLYTSPSPRDS